MFVFDPESEHFTYSDILHRIQLKKTRLNGEDKRRRGAIVHRREYSEAEMDRRHQLLADYGAEYYEQLDSDEFVREHKRRRATEKRAGGAKSPAAQSAPAMATVAEDEEEETKSAHEDESDKAEETGESAPVSATATEAATTATNGSNSPVISDGSSSASDNDSE